MSPRARQLSATGSPSDFHMFTFHCIFLCCVWMHSWFSAPQSTSLGRALAPVCFALHHKLCKTARAWQHLLRRFCCLARELQPAPVCSGGGTSERTPSPAVHILMSSVAPLGHRCVRILLSMAARWPPNGHPMAVPMASQRPPNI